MTHIDAGSILATKGRSLIGIIRRVRGKIWSGSAPTHIRPLVIALSTSTRRPTLTTLARGTEIKLKSRHIAMSTLARGVILSTGKGRCSLEVQI